jgi:CRP-like cAMP-binding protein
MDPDRLKSIPLFSSLPDAELRTIAAFGDELSVPEGKRLVNEGEYAYHFLAIEEGTASVRHGDEEIATLGPGDVFGEMGLLERTQRNASVVATSPMRLISLTRWDLGRMPEVAARVRALMDERRAPAS